MTTPIHDLVRDHYAGIALNIANDPSCSGNGDCCGTPNYTAEELASLPDAAALASLGCGNPTRRRRPSRRRAGPRPRLRRWHRRAPLGQARRADRARLRPRHDRRDARPRPSATPPRPAPTNVEFLKGHIEAIPLPADSIDVVISNCVINLAADKPAVFARDRARPSAGRPDRRHRHRGRRRALPPQSAPSAARTPAASPAPSRSASTKRGCATPGSRTSRSPRPTRRRPGWSRRSSVRGSPKDTDEGRPGM